MPHSRSELENQSSFSLYSQEFQRFQLYKDDLAKQSELTTFMAMVIGKSNPLTVDLLRQWNNMSSKYSKGAKFKMYT